MDIARLGGGPGADQGGADGIRLHPAALFRRQKVKITSRPYHYLSSDGFHIYVGKNNYQNEELTFKTANGGDWVVPRQGNARLPCDRKTEGKELPDRVFEEAGALAAYYSRGRENDKVEIDYIQRKKSEKSPRRGSGLRGIPYQLFPSGHAGDPGARGEINRLLYSTLMALG